MKLPSKPYKHKEQYAAILALYQTIDQLIDYLAEREGEQNGLAASQARDTQVVMDKLLDDDLIERMRPNYDLNDPRGWEGNKKTSLSNLKWHLSSKKQTITLPKPEWWDDESNIMMSALTTKKEGYRAALEATSKASGILFKLED